jgi:hypothetical protein
LKLAGLIHDAAEAFIGDLPYPIRKAGGVGKFEHLDGKISLWLYEDLGIRHLIGHPEIAEADRIMAATEYRDLCDGDPGALGMPPPLLSGIGVAIEWPAHRWLSMIEGLAGR